MSDDLRPLSEVPSASASAALLHRRGIAIHLESGDRAMDGPVRTFGPYAGQPDWRAGTACGGRVATNLVTRRAEGVTCADCVETIPSEPHLTANGRCSECGNGGRHLIFPPEDAVGGGPVAVCTYCDLRLYEAAT